MPISFPSSPTTGDLYTYNSKTWQWNGEGWVTYPTQNDGSIAYAAADYNYQRAVACRESNLWINSGGFVDQENLGTASSTAASGNFYAGDQHSCVWQVSSSTLYARRWDAPSGLIGYQHYIGYVATAAITYGSTDYCGIVQRFEGTRMRHLRFGYSDALRVRLGFWFFAVRSGTYCAGLRNSANNRTFVRKFTYTTGNTWQWIDLEYPGETTGTWAVDGTKWGEVYIGGAQGSTYGSATADTWQTIDDIATSDATNPFQAASDSMFIIGAVLVPASLEFPTDTSYHYLMQKPTQEELPLCWRYYQQSKPGQASSFNVNSPYSFVLPVAVANTIPVNLGVQYAVPMRTTPTVTLYDASTSGSVNVAGVTRTAAAIDNFASGFGAIQNNSGVTWADQAAVKVNFVASARM